MSEIHTWLETHSDPFVLLDDDLRVVAVNRAYGAVFRVDPDALAGRPARSLAHRRAAAPEEDAGEEPYLKAIEGRDKATWLHAYVDLAGDTHWVRVTLFPLQSATGAPLLGELVQEVASHDTQPSSPYGGAMVGKSAIFARTVAQLAMAATGSGPVLIHGETGTGKELAAAFIHRHSPRRHRPFLCLDCASLPESLCESEVFGHEHGAFTGSVRTKKGLFELAHGGTLLLDEIGEMPLAMQAKLLRVLEAGEFRRVGGERIIKVDVRVVCATHRDLWQCVQAGTFREDLYYRIACFYVPIPPLRERLGDLPLLAEEILHTTPEAAGRPFTLTPQAIDFLTQYDFPGNIRELRNLLEVAVASSGEAEIGIDTLRGLITARQPWAGRQPAPGDALPSGPHGPSPYGGTGRAGRLFAPPDPAASGAPRTRHHVLAEMEHHYLIEMLRTHGGHRRKTADAMGISERTLYRKLRRYGLS